MDVGGHGSDRTEPGKILIGNLKFEAFFDFEQKVIGVDSFIVLSGDADADMAAIQARLGHHRGKRPHLAAPIRLSGNKDAKA